MNRDYQLYTVEFENPSKYELGFNCRYVPSNWSLRKRQVVEEGKYVTLKPFSTKKVTVRERGWSEDMTLYTVGWDRSN